MTTLGEILACARPTGEGFTATIPANWLQGRTAYGGLSGALALHAAMGSEADLPPLRSAQISFIGPLSGDVTVSAARLRRGRNAAFIQADVTGEAGLGLRATFCFMAALPSQVTHDERSKAPVAPPVAEAELYTGPDHFFTGNFNFLDMRDGLGPAEWLRWGRLRERDGLDPFVELLAVADGLPPAALKLFEKQVTPLSTLTWQINFLAAEPATQDGWWLLNAGTESARDGNSSQRMTIWNSQGDPVAEAMQSVAIFA